MIISTCAGCEVDYSVGHVFEKISVDEAFDRLDAELEEIHAEKLEFARQGIESDGYYSHHSMQTLNELEQIYNKIWDFIKNDDAEEYYLNTSRTKLYEQLFAFCSVEIRYTIFGTPGGPSQASIAHTKDFVELAALAECDGKVTAVDKVSTQVVYAAKHNPGGYRLFLCKECGRDTQVEKSHDNWMLSRGLQPSRRCDLCRITGKYKKQLGIK